MHWHPSDLADAVAAGFTRRAEADDREHAVYGFDALDELGLHPVIQDAFTQQGLGVWPEQRYPGHWHKTKRSSGIRCDLVLTPDGLPMRDPTIRGTLFDNGQAVDAEAAYWLEVKTVAQFETGGPFKRYSAELLSPVMKDVGKIWSDGIIRHGGLLIVLFTGEQMTAEHDLAIWHERCLRKGYPVGPPAVRGLPLTDRIGNAWCSVALFGVRGV
ncbi:MAG: hypothetical protein ACPGYV_03515 [Phycisphaeraceae bacterium]